MRPKHYKTVLSLFFLLLFTSSKVSSYHDLVHDHEANISQCETCINILAAQFSPLNFEDHTDTDVRIFEDKLDKTAPVLMIELYHSEQFTLLYSRPPPSFS